MIDFCFQALDMLNKFVAECDRKTENAKRKLQETQEELGEEAARKVSRSIDRLIF